MANQAKEGGTRPPQSSKANHVKPDSSVIARAAGVLLVCVLLATVVVAMLWWHQDSVYRYVGGEIRHVSAQSTPQEVLKEVYPDKSQKELDLIRALQEKTTLYISHTVTAYWVSQTFHNGWI